MTLKHDSEVILQKNPSAICINFTENPSLKNLLPVIKESTTLHILEESEDHIIIDSLPSKTRVRMRFVATDRPYQNQSRFVPPTKLFRKKESVFTSFLKNIGIEAKPIGFSTKHTDNKSVINASGIIF